MNLSPSLPIDLNKLVETRLLVQGSSGSGKTVAVKRLLEQTLGAPAVGVVTGCHSASAPPASSLSQAVLASVTPNYAEFTTWNL